MKILFYGMNFSPELTGVGKYSGEMINFLVMKGHEVFVVTAPPYYPGWKVFNNYSSWKYKSEKIADKFNICRCPIYIPKNPTSLTRIIHLFSFALFSLPLMLKKIFWKPDLVIFIEPSIFCAPCALVTAKIARAKSVLHIQDYEIDAMFGLGIMKENRLLRILKKIERYIMRSSDRVSSISYSMINMAIKKSVAKDKIIFFPNWVDTKFISPSGNRQRFRKAWGIKEDTKIILYSGNIGKKQGLEMVLESAEYFKNNDDVLFLIIGDGANKSTLVQISNEKQLSNVHFKPLQPYEDMPDLLAMADIHLVVQRIGAADIVLPSKLTGILSAGGHALITAEPHTELGLLAKKVPGIAHFVKPESLSEFISGLNVLLNSDTLRPNLIARKYALDELEHDVVLNRFEQELMALVYK